jgi:hypothetical protein
MAPGGPPTGRFTRATEMTMIVRNMTVAILLLAPMQRVSAQSIHIGGQIRPRMELRDDNARDLTTSMRSRLDVSSDVAHNVFARLQFQDIRTFGSEASTTTGTAQIDLHQAYVDLGGQTSRLSTRVGRQEVSFGEERLVGAADWIQQARAFDGVKARIGVGRVAVQPFVFQISDASVPGRTRDEYFSGVYATAALSPGTW